nr:hypothetical protein Iba_chr04fCG4370 [Ipomoea batatas]
MRALMSASLKQTESNRGLTSSTLDLMDLLHEVRLKTANIGFTSSALDLTDLLHEVRLKTAHRGFTSTLLEISTDLLRELPSRLNGMNTMLGLNKATVFAGNTPLRSEDPLRICQSKENERIINMKLAGEISLFNISTPPAAESPIYVELQFSALIWR